MKDLFKTIGEKIGEYLDVRDDNGETPTHFAALNGDTKTLKVLKEAGADMKAKDNEGRAPAHAAAVNGHTEALKCLRELGADMEDKDNFGITPAHGAIFSGNTETFIYLVEEVKVDVEAKTENGIKLIHFAILFEYTKMVECLIKAKADLNAMDGDGRTPLDLINYFESRDIRVKKELKDLLVRNGAKTGEELREEEKQKAAFGRAGRPCDDGNNGHSGKKA